MVRLWQMAFSMLLCMVLTACGGNQHSAAQPPHLGIASPKLLAQVMDAVIPPFLERAKSRG